MTAAALPPTESERLRALHGLHILDTPCQERFDCITRFAAQEFDVPIVLLSLVDTNRQWFKSRVGMALQETTREVSFCAHAILEPNILIVEDAKCSAMFRDNPLVVGEPYIRFYAGAQLRLRSGEAMGTLCLIDTRPRKLDSLDCTILAALRNLALQELLTRRDSEL